MTRPTAPLWTYQFHDLRTNERLGELPLADPSLSGSLNDVGDWSASLALGDAEVRALDPRGITTPGRTAMYASRGGVIVYGGVVWQRTPAPASLALQGKDFLSYFARRFIRERLSYAKVDQCSIMRSILSWAQGLPAGSIGVTYDSVLSGVLRDRTYEVFDVKQVLEALIDVANLDDGPDLAIDVFTNGDGSPGRVLTLGWPARGQQPGTSTLALNDINSTSWTWQEDGEATRTLSMALGSGDGDAMLIATAVEQTLIDNGYPLLEDKGEYKDVTDLGTLVSHAVADLAASAGIVVNPTFTIRMDQEPYVGSWSTGDWFHVSISSDGLEAGTPPTRVGRYSGWLRCIAYTMHPASETAELTMGGVLTS